jgi:hypothetical protein
MLILRSASRLDAFSAYHCRTPLPGTASGDTAGTQEVRPPRSSRTRGRLSQHSTPMVDRRPTFCYFAKPHPKLSVLCGGAPRGALCMSPYSSDYIFTPFGAFGV